MLTHVEIKGYKSLKDASLDMNGLTVLIGPNGSGKSNFLDVFKLMSEAGHGRLREGLIQRGEVLFTGSGKGFSFSFEFILEGKTLQYELLWDSWLSINKEILQAKAGKELFVKRGTDKSLFYNRHYSEPQEKPLDDETELAIFQVKDKGGYAIPYILLRELHEWITYMSVDVGTTSNLRLPQLFRKDKDVHLLPDGSNLFSVLNTIQQEEPAVWEGIQEILQSIYPDFRYMTFPSEGGEGKILLRWWESPFEKSHSFSANVLSDGTLRLLCLLAILKTPKPPPLICIEEPELGLHPDWIKLVAELLEEAATRTQIIVTTHSPTLVSHVQPKHVVVVEKEDGATYLERLSAEKLSAWLEEFQLGDLWLAGHLGGRP